MVGFLMGLPSEYTKYPWYLFFWDRKADIKHYTKQSWQVITELCIGKENVKVEPIVEAEKVLMPILHIKG